MAVEWQTQVADRKYSISSKVIFQKLKQIKTFSDLKTQTEKMCHYLTCPIRYSKGSSAVWKERTLDSNSNSWI